MADKQYIVEYAGEMGRIEDNVFMDDGGVILRRFDRVFDEPIDCVTHGGKIYAHDLPSRDKDLYHRKQELERLDLPKDIKINKYVLSTENRLLDTIDMFGESVWVRENNLGYNKGEVKGWIQFGKEIVDDFPDCTYTSDDWLDYSLSDREVVTDTEVYSIDFQGEGSGKYRIHYSDNADAIIQFDSRGILTGFYRLMDRKLNPCTKEEYSAFMDDRLHELAEKTIIPYSKLKDIHDYYHTQEYTNTQKLSRRLNLSSKVINKYRNKLGFL